ncbi:MAG: manganese-dependent inorganic pyrophosphatase [Desulfovibrio sp.]|jgi:manganese-dependent inorganic pyrophosphatase|nr:manganese-dependent inorganic pyrophosphatase [Desulfovibrio sp.]
MAALVVGHKSPDTDSVISAIAVADLMSKRGIQAKPVTQGDVTPETAFVLDKFGLAKPEVATSVAGKQVILVDHSDLAQAPSDVKDSEIIAIVDHHKLGDVTTSSPLLMWVWPAGCTGTVIKAMYDFYGVEVSKNIAGGLLCAILSDTVIFKSPTTTDDDKKAVESLAKIAGIADYKGLGMDMFKVKSAVDGVPARDLVFRDYKDFDMSGKKIGIGQLEVIDLSMLDKVKAALAAEITKVKAEGRHSVFLLLTDIMKEGSEMLICSDDPSVVKKAFGVDGDKAVWLPKVMSRKKDVVPKFEAVFKA